MGFNKEKSLGVRGFDTFELLFERTLSVRISNVDRLSQVHVYADELRDNSLLFNGSLFNQSIFNQETEIANCEITPTELCYFPNRKEYEITFPSAIEGSVVLIGSLTVPIISFVAIPDPDNFVFINGDNIIFTNADNVVTI